MDSSVEVAGERPIASGAVTSVAALPELSDRELRRLDAWMLAGDLQAGLPGFVARACRRARRRAVRDLRVLAREHARAHPDPDEEVSGGVVLERSRSLWVRLGVGPGFLGSAVLRLPWHSSSTRRAGALTPWVSGGQVVFEGPLIGVEHLSGTPFRFDVWSAYRSRMVTSVNGIVAGMMSSGKSMFLKTLATRELQAGRRVIVMSDPKGEWARVAHAVGGIVICPGAGGYLNILDVPARREGEDEDEWVKGCVQARSVALRGLVTALRSGVTPSEGEQALLDAACERLTVAGPTPTVARLVDLLTSGWPVQARIRGLDDHEASAAARTLTLSLDKLVHGALRGAFEHESTVRVDPSSVMIVFDTSGIEAADEVRRSVYTAALSSWIDRILASKDGVFRLIIAEEGWEVISNPALVEAYDRRIRLSGEYACSSWLLLHELKDLDKFGELGGMQREKINGILTLSEIKVIYRQSPSSLAYLRELLTDLTDDEVEAIASMPQGVALWRVGNRVRTLVHPLMSSAAYEVFNTDRGRGG